VPGSGSGKETARETSSFDSREFCGPSRPYESVLLGALWRQFERFPPDTVERVLPLLTLPMQTRRFVEIWIEENRGKAA
jgi:hypothetical protein